MSAPRRPAAMGLEPAATPTRVEQNRRVRSKAGSGQFALRSSCYVSKCDEGQHRCNAKQVRQKGF